MILCHAWRGRDEFICEKTREIAQKGYAGFALDMYGKGVLGKSREENAQLKKPFFGDANLLQKRVLKGYEIASRLSHVDAEKIAVLGFGFGGLCALVLAKSGVNLKGAISVYGHFTMPSGMSAKPITAKVLILHGYNDPVVTQNELYSFEKEMDNAKVDWQAHIFSQTMHAFATPSANDPLSGILYNPLAERRSWIAIYNFLEELFSKSE